MLDEVIQNLTTVVRNEESKCLGGSLYMMNTLISDVLEEAEDMTKFGKASVVVCAHLTEYETE